MGNQIELTIRRKAEEYNRVYKQIIPGQCVKNGLIDLVAAATEADLGPDEFIACYAMMTAEIKKEEGGK